MNMELHIVEYKQLWRDEFLKEICGFANAQGGTLYIGIDDKGDVVGLQHAQKLFWGRGIQQVQKSFQSINLPAPLFEDKFDGTSVAIYRNNRLEKVQNGTKDGTKELTDRQSVIVGLLYQNGTINIPTLARMVNAGERTVKRDLSILQQRGYIERVNGRKDGFWKVVYMQ